MLCGRAFISFVIPNGLIFFFWLFNYFAINFTYFALNSENVGRIISNFLKVIYSVLETTQEFGKNIFLAIYIRFINYLKNSFSVYFMKPSW